MKILKEVRMTEEGTLEGITLSGISVILTSPPKPKICWVEENIFSQKEVDKKGDDKLVKNLKRMIRLQESFGLKEQAKGDKKVYHKLSDKLFIQFGNFEVWADFGFHRGAYLGYGGAYNVFEAYPQKELRGIGKIMEEMVETDPTLR